LKPFLAIFLLCITAFAGAQDIFGTDEEAFVLLPAEVISGGPTRDAAFSHSGRWVTYQKRTYSSLPDLLSTKESPNWRWFAYDRKTKSTKSLTVPADIDTIEVMGDDATVFVAGEDYFGFFSLTTAKFTRLEIPDGYDLLSEGIPTFAPYAFLQKDDHYCIIFPDATRLEFDAKGFDVGDGIGYDQHNIYFYATRGTGNAEKSGRLAVSKATAQLAFAELTDDEVVRLVRSLSPVEHAFVFTNRNENVYVQAEEEPPAKPGKLPFDARVGAGSDYAISRMKELVVYYDAGALLLREIKPVDIQLAKSAVDEALRQKLLKKAKTVGIALMLYAADWDDVMPGQENWQTDVLPYTKDAELLKEFNYTFRGGNIAEIKNPESIEMGFVLGPNGRAVVYLDGHTKWVSNP